MVAHTVKSPADLYSTNKSTTIVIESFYKNTMM